jgi:hypothetical protein
MQVHLGKLQVINDPSKPPHPGAMQTPLIFVLITVDHIEVPAI